MRARVLAVDDEEGILKIIRAALERSGMEVDTVSDPLRLLEAGFPIAQYDLVMLDVMMPGMDGFELLERLRDQTDCPVLFLTAKTAEEDVMKGLGLGADDYIRKPFGIGELRCRAEAHIRREKREKRYAAVVGEVRLFLQEKRIEAKGRKLSLTAGEYEICEFLALHRGQVFSREQIYEHVFGYDGRSDDSAITEHIKNIRAKFRESDLEPIETVWGIGYKWKA